MKKLATTLPFALSVLPLLVLLTLLGCTRNAPTPTDGVPTGMSSRLDDSSIAPAPMVETARVDATIPTPEVTSDAGTTPSTPGVDPGEWTPPEAWAFDKLGALQAIQNAAGVGKPLADLSRYGAGQFVRGDVTVINGYCFRGVLSGRDGQPYFDDHDDLVGDAFAVYSWPETGRGRAFCAFSGGILCTAAQDQYVGQTDGPAPNAAFADGAGRTFGAGLFGPARGVDGNRWDRVPETIAQQEFRIRVVDTMGQPVPRFGIFVGDPSWITGTNDGVPVENIVNLGDRLLPMGQLMTDENGQGVFRGIHVRGHVLATGVPADSITVEDEGLGILLRVTAASATAAQRQANEAAAIATLKNISSSQAQMQACGVQDTNGNGAGEYAFFAELSGSKPLRRDPSGQLGIETISPPVLSAAFGNVEHHVVTRSGYMFQMWLPGPDGEPRTESHSGGSEGIALDPAMAEVTWCCYAWPAKGETTGQRTFFINQWGDVWATEPGNTSYSGHERPPASRAFFNGADLSDPFRLDGPTAIPHTGSDGRTWTVVN